MKPDPKIEAVCSEARWPLTDSDKYVIRVIWNRYRKLYKQQQQGKLKRGEYATRRRNYLNLVYDIMGLYSVEQDWQKIPPYEEAMFVQNIKDGSIHEVRKYIKSDDGEVSIWCNTWYGHHRIGVDCKFTQVL
jgi:hypothetical protein